MSRTPSFRQASNKENLFIQIANKKSQSLTKKCVKYETSKYADEHYEDLIQKINQLDQENLKLRELLKKSNYLQFKFVDVSKSDFDFHSLSEIKNKSFDLSLDELKAVNLGRSNDLFNSKKVQTPRQSLAAKQVSAHRQRNCLINSYTQELIQEQTTFDYQVPEETQQEQETNFSEFYKEILMNVVNKDMKIFKHIDKVIQQELKQNFQSNFNNYEKQKFFMGSLIQLLTNMQNYCFGDHPDNHFIMRAYKQLQLIILEIFRLFEKMKIHVLPLNNMPINFQERIQEYDKLEETTAKAIQSLHGAQIIIEQLTKENEKLIKKNKEYEDFFTQISYKLQINNEESQLKQSLDDLMQRCIESIIKLQNYEFQLSQKNQQGNSLSYSIESDFIEKLKKINEKYDNLKFKYNKNKEKFKQYLIKINSCFSKNIKKAQFETFKIDEQVGHICSSISSFTSNQ